MSRLPARRLLLVHAHPDDESIINGVTMARYVAEGAHVTLVTCTLGEQGEVIPATLAHLATDREPTGVPDTPGALLTPLAAHRRAELGAAMAALGVRDHRLLGGPGRYRDSGMMGSPENDHPDCFWRADVERAADLLAEVVREVRPQVLVTYDPDGGYGHPDHIQAHRVAMRAAELAADPDHHSAGGPVHRIARVDWSGVGRTQLAEGFAHLHAVRARTPFSAFQATASAEDVPGVMADEEVAVAVVGDRNQAAAKAAAMAAHATQLVVEGSFFALSNGLGQPLFTTEQYRRATPPGFTEDAGAHGADAAGPGGPPLDDLFAGIAGVPAAGEAEGDGPAEVWS